MKVYFTFSRWWVTIAVTEIPSAEPSALLSSARKIITIHKY